jgi:hypothetical protein
MRKKKFILLIIIILLCIPVYLWIKRQLEIDSCLDKGGRWNYESGKCECQAQKDSLRQ